MMIEVPSRISNLIERLEAGEQPSSDELRRLAQLQALDVAKLGEDYVRQEIAEGERRTEKFRQFLES